MVTKIAATGYELEIVQRVVEATRTLYDLPDDVSDEMAHFSDRLQEMTVHHWPVAEELVTVDVDADLPVEVEEPWSELDYALADIADDLANH